MNQATSLPRPHSRGGLFWALVPVVLLASSVFGVGSMAFVATHDPSFATEPDYYQKSLAWNQVQAQAAENARLAYTLALPTKVSLRRDQRALVQLTLRDRAGQLVEGARVHADAFSNLAADQVSTLQFEPRGAAVYETSLLATRAGVWVFRVSADRASDHFTAELRTELVPGGAP